MRGKLERMVKLGLFFCLALTFYKGFMKLPEIYPVLNPAGFFRGLVNDRENSLIMKERHFDINYQTGRAIEMRLKEMDERGESPAGNVLPDRERVELALRKTRAKDMRNADSVVLAEENLSRARRLESEGWAMGWSLEGAAAGRAGKTAPGGSMNGSSGPASGEAERAAVAVSAKEPGDAAYGPADDAAVSRTLIGSKDGPVRASGGPGVPSDSGESGEAGK